MRKIKVANRLLIAADKSEIFTAIIDEISGHSAWSRPYLYFKAAQSSEQLRIGDQKWVYISPLGFPRMLLEVIEISPPEAVKVKYVDGDFVGLGSFALTDYQDQTEVIFSWDTVTNTLTFRIMSYIFPLRAMHWLIVDRVLLRLEQYINRRDLR